VLLPCLAYVDPRRGVVGVRHVELTDISHVNLALHHQLHRSNDRLDLSRGLDSELL
jgi:hypothetical protein